jgi:hypothetical protein
MEANNLVDVRVDPVSQGDRRGPDTVERRLVLSSKRDTRTPMFALDSAVVSSLRGEHSRDTHLGGRS